MSRPTWTPAYIGIGSNLDNPREQVLRGMSELDGLTDTRVVLRSKLYETDPIGPQDQPQYVNAVAAILTKQTAQDLLGGLKALEKEIGRGEPVVRWGPRLIDFDLLAFGSERIDTEALKVPHPGVADRAFVLVPWMDVAPHFSVPGLGSVASLRSRVDASGVRAL